ncbi:MAG: site-specific integrase [Actinomycetota bacterium]|nr:site-specific integrase [Actinomycetota bacterium]
MSRRRTFGSIRALSSGRYQARYTSPDGARHRAPRSFATKAEASQWLATVETEFARGTWTDPDAGRVSLDGYARSWVETRANLRPRTVDLYESLEHHIVPPLGDREIGTLSAGTVRRWYSQLVRRSGAGSLTPAKSYRLLRTILSAAVADGLIARNPCAIVGAGIERSAERPVATLAQVWALADAVPPRFRALVLTAAFGGLRFGELAGLTRDCVDLGDGTITVRRALVQRDDGTLQLGPPKSEAGRRTFTIPAALVPELTAHLARYVEPGDDALVFVGAKGARLRRSNWSVLWKQATEKVGVPGLRLHDLRHTCNTLTAATGASTRELMHRMGHASPRAALRYQHATRDRDVVIATALDQIIQEGTP